MNKSEFHKIMDALFGSIMIEVYKFTGGDFEKAKEIINRVLVSLGGGEYKRFPKTWVETHKNDSTYSMKELMKIIDKTDCPTLPIIVKILLYVIESICNSKCTDREISETTAMFEAYFWEKVKTDTSGLFDGFTIK
ncbi:MAG: hypothetical protein ACTTKC_08035 [Treponema sp.]|uniref:hypothetical protein n=1 Tax=Treponema sp. TaxID=166 RepID=UPI003FA1DF09